MTPTPTPMLLTARDAARMLAISPRTLWGLRRHGLIPIIIPGRGRARMLRYRIDDVRAWIGRQEVAT